MKKVLAILLILVWSFSLFGCGGKTESQDVEGPGEEGFTEMPKLIFLGCE